MKKIKLLGVSAIAIFVVTGCSRTRQQWNAEHITTLSGFKVPECALHASDSGIIFVSNMENKPNVYWLDDGKGYISVMGEDNRVTSERWIESTTAFALHAPKGMCLMGENLYIADNTRLVRCAVSGGNMEVLASGFKRANDLATDGRNIWLSDTAAGKIYCISQDGDKREIPAPTSINGITFSGKKMFGVSWDLHEVYELDPSGKKAPVAFGLAGHFKNLDGIEVLDDGTFIVSDCMGNAVYAISPDRSCVSKLIDIPSPADIGLNRKEGILYVPQLLKDKLSVYQIGKKTP